ncbi:pyruvate dehydrogenase complex dihydrolipoamide acetyltransferase [Taibaiella soli]|uniref:Acetyltransferase component of pyruvate dehydrogenase complex n=1 Tax=Taibaiella soli TaxID=1649169 RepID=A0A2W2C0Z2_9BACT|nr:pyruvate dehydrogenase complex dihydrolipoamide acetyltransferase [Taibaiella soli]PZF73683.1 pyruvate dehydrogenase complex dihydrolipoamide acetyltransferase [Taibaiella soli]
MAEAIRMPLLSDTMKEGVIAAWHKKVGDTIKSDDVLADVETDKATMEVTPYVDGTLLYIGVEQGKAAKVNDIIAIIGKPGEDYKSLLDAPASAPAAEAQPQEQAAPAQPATAPVAETPAPAPAAQPQQPLSGDATVIRMPLLSDTMTEGKIVAWNKKVGDIVKSDDSIADVETDKATMEVVPYVDGTLLYVGIPAGQAAKVNEIIAIIGKPGTDVAPYLAQDGAATAQPAAAPQQEAAPAATATPAPATTPATTEQPAASSDERLKASPLAKKLAEAKGVDLHLVKGSGDNGRIVKRDVDNYQPAAQPAVASVQPAATGAAKAPATVAQPVVTGQEGHVDHPLSQMRKVIARRLAESKFTAPHFYLRMTITMDNAIAARKAINEVSPVKVSFNDLIIKAVAMTLRKHPEVNSSWMGDFIRENQHIHVGTAVAVDEGLIVPVIKFADQKSLSQIAQEAGSLIDKARNKKLQPQEFTGNTFTISNLGMMDIDEFTAIINPPDSCILAIGKIEATPVVENNQVVIRQLLKLTMSCDHRVVDGAVGARFMQTLKAHLENPVTMLV